MTILELTPKVSALSHPREDVNGRRGLDKVVPSSSKVAQADVKSGNRPIPNALPIPRRSPSLT